MKRAKGTARSRSSKHTPAAGTGLGKPVDLATVRQEITNLVGGQAVEMVEMTIQEATQGHYAAMKYLFEMVGLYPATAPPGTPVEDSLARTLLRRLGLPEEAMVDTQVTKDREPASQAETTNAVE